MPATTASPRVPSHLTKRTKGIWRSLVAEYDFSEHELALVRAALEEIDTADAAESQLRKDGLFTINRYGSTVAHPGIKIAKDAKLAAARLFRELRMTEVADELERPPRTRGRH